MPLPSCRQFTTTLLSALVAAVACTDYPVIAAAAESEPRIAGRTRTEWHSATANPQPETRRQAVAALSQFGPEALPQLASLVSDADPAVRIWALRGLKRIRRRGATPPSAGGKLTAKPRSDEQPLAGQPSAGRETSGRETSEHSWSEQDSRRAVELAAARLDDPHASVRIAAASTLASHDHVKPALDTLVAALASPIPGARIEAISELQSLGTAATPVLDAIRAADDAPNAGDYVTRIRNQILESLANNSRPEKPGN